MNKTHLYYASMAVLGGVMIATSLPRVLSGEFAFSPILLSMAGVGIVATSLFSAFSAPASTEWVPSDRLVWLTAAFAALAAVATAWTAVA